MNPYVEADGLHLPEVFRQRKRIILGELKERSLWLVRLRWWVAPSILVAIAVARLLGVGFGPAPLAATALFILAYNVALHRFGRPIAADPATSNEYVQRFTYAQVGLDYAAMFLLIHFTGGAASPLIFFFIFHIIFASILLPPLSAYFFAGLVAAGMAFIGAAEYPGIGLLDHHALFYHNRAINLADRPFHFGVELAFFSASVFITSFSTAAIMRMLRKRILDLATLSENITTLNDRLSSLFAMVQAMGSAQRLKPVLDTATLELARAMGVEAVSVKLLSEDGKLLEYASSWGLPESFTREALEVEKSPLNRAALAGETVKALVNHREMFHRADILDSAGIKSVLLVPLASEDRIAGVMGAYSSRTDRFGNDDVDFLRLAAGIVAIALENVRAYESIERLVQERSRFMQRVAHNLRAPLAAMLSILEVIRGGYYGPVTDQQGDYLRRIDRRAHSMLSMISELMTLSKAQGERTASQKPVDLKAMAARVQKTFSDDAQQKNLKFSVTFPEELPPIAGDAEMLEQLLENLVSNAIKYTPVGGRVGLLFLRGASDKVQIEVSDSGIGIPRAEMPRLFTEFFRAENARAVEEVGTGLGLAIVKDVVDRHGGKIFVESEEGLGTVFAVHLPSLPKEAV